MKFYVEKSIDTDNYEEFPVMAIRYPDDIDDRTYLRAGSLIVRHGISPDMVIDALISEFYPDGYAKRPR